MRSGSGGRSILPAGSPLPASATAYTDTPPSADQVDCYSVAALSGAATLATSDVLCRYQHFQSGAAPGGFAIELDQGQTASLSWSAPGGQTGYILGRLPANVAGATWQTTSLGAGATRATVSVGTQSTCFVLIALKGTAAPSNTDILCGIPGQSTPAAGSAA